jgi:helix-turn-helix protein
MDHCYNLDLRSSQEIAELLGITVECLITWRRARKGPAFIRLGRKIAYDMQDVNSWLVANKQQAPREL